MRAAAALLALGASVLAGCAKSDALAKDAPSTAAVEQRDLVLSVQASGTVEALRVVEVKSKASGEVQKLNAETGDVVQAGTVLAQIDPRDVSNAYAQAQADLDVARVTVRTSQAEKSRAEQLRQAQIITQDEYEAAVEKAAGAQATLVRAETNHQLASQRMGDVTIRAPIVGTVIERPVEVGQIIASATSNVSGGTTILKMADLSQVQVRALVDETDLGQVKPGQRARVTVDAYPNRPFIGTVTKIEPEAVVDQNVTMFPVLVRLDNAQGLLKPGMNTEVQIDVARRANAVAIPDGAVVSFKDLAKVAQTLGVPDDELAALRAARSGGTPRSGGGSHGAASDGVSGAGASASAGSNAGAASSTSASGAGRQAWSGAGDSHPGIVFVPGAGGPEPRRVMLGISDWEYTEVLSGLKPGERVVLASAARLQGQQQAQQNEMKQRAGGMMGMGGGAPRGAGGGR
jgi:HlyD family secretion protein